jgi:hypothetical protein
MTVSLATLLVLIVAFGAEVGWLMAEPLLDPREISGREGISRATSLPAVVPTAIT